MSYGDDGLLTGNHGGDDCVGESADDEAANVAGLRHCGYTRATVWQFAGALDRA